MRFLANARTSLCRGLMVAAGALLAVQGVRAQEPIRIGAVLSVSGPAAFLGDPEQKTLEMYVERINAAGGVAGSSSPMRRRMRSGQFLRSSAAKR